MKNKEIRSLGKVEAKDNEKVITGYALKFETLSENFGNWRETIAKSALDNADLSDVRCFFNHDSSKVLGRTTAETLELEIDDIGLKVTCSLPETSYSEDLYRSIQRGDISQMSFAFTLGKQGDHFAKQSDGTYIRTLKNIEKISEVSVVSIPAYSDTNIAVAQRNLEEVEDELKKRQIQLLLQLELEAISV